MFTQVNRVVTQTERRSSLFNLVEQLIEEKHSILEKYKLEKLSASHKDREAFFLLLEEPLDTPLFGAEGYLLKGRHLSIDKLYSKENSIHGACGFTYAHYTEQYLNSITNEEIIVHAYFNMQGQYLFSQVKKMPDQYLAVDSNLEHSIINNSISASTLLHELLLEKSKRYENALDEANKKELELEELSRPSSFRSVKKQYLKIAELFLSAIKKINFLNDLEVDMRGQLVKVMIDRFGSSESEYVDRELVIQEKHQTEEQEQAEDQEESIQPKAAVISSGKSKGRKKHLKVQHLEKVQDLEGSYLKLLRRIEALEKALEKYFPFKEDDVKNVLAAHEVAEHLKRMLFTLVFFDFEPKKGEKQKTLQRIEDKISKMPKLITLLEKSLLVGNVKNFQLLFEKVGSGVTFGFFFNFMRELVFMDRDPSLLKNQIEILDFLFEHSEAYRASMLNWGICIMVGPGGIGLSCLSHAIRNRNYAVFSTLLRHGYNVNASGIYLEGKMISHMRAEIFFGGDKEYIESLLAHGASIDQREVTINDPSKLQAIKGIPKDLKKLSADSLKASKDHLKRLEQPLDPAFQEIVNTKWDILFAAKNARYLILPLLAEVSDLAAIASAISEIASNKNILCRGLVDVSSAGIFFAKDTPTLENITQFLLKNDGSLQDRCASILYAKESESERFKPVEALCDVFSKKCLKNPETIDVAIKVIERELASLERTNFHGQICFYRACTFLISEKGKLSFMDLQFLMRCQYMIGVNTEKLSVDYKPYAERCFVMAINIAHSSTHFEELKATPTFVAACKKLKGTPYEYREESTSGSTPEAAMEMLPQFQLSKENSATLSIDSSNNASNLARAKQTK